LSKLLGWKVYPASLNIDGIYTDPQHLLTEEFRKDSSKTPLLS